MKQILIFVLALFSTQAIYAIEPSIAQIVCQGLNAPTVNVAVYSFDVGYPPVAGSALREATFVTDPAALPALLLAAGSGAGYSCTLSGSSASLTLSSVTLSEVAFTALTNGTYGFQSESFATIVVTYKSLTPGGFSSLPAQTSGLARPLVAAASSPPQLVCQPTLGPSLTLPLDLITVAAAPAPPLPGGAVTAAPIFGGEIIADVSQLPQLLGSYAKRTTYSSCTLTGDFPTYKLLNVSFGFPTSVEVAAGLATQNSSVNTSDSRTVQAVLNIGSIAPGGGTAIGSASNDTKRSVQRETVSR